MRILATTTVVATLLAGSAFADDAFTLGTSQLDGVTASGTVNFLTEVVKNVDINKQVNLNVNKQVTSNVQLNGTLATAEGSADSIGFDNNLAEVDTFAQVEPRGAFAFSESLAAGSFFNGLD